MPYVSSQTWEEKQYKNAQLEGGPIQTRHQLHTTLHTFTSYIFQLGAHQSLVL